MFEGRELDYEMNVVDNGGELDSRHVIVEDFVVLDKVEFKAPKFKGF